ncbi:hypothetical protein RJ639_046910 [Escallonia herrerae]|uniref:Myb/SANT-like domain-containing protein n=1 Tax=Escallonia herrerae TaxID=1293975 RepID=A0AA88W6G5_9ASTE|nr:hypothetical protein RJ639_046910 [Escallonia herrerae]
MASLFNAKFKFQNKKDVLKNRHKTLRNLYKATKNLLDQEGFRWDETRQMVTADDRVWDDYIKVHPDARSYRIKSIPHFSDLCEIYKNTTVEGKWHIYSQTADIDSTVPASDTLGVSPATPVNDGKPGDSLMESSSHSVGDTTVAVGPSSVGEASAEALQEIMVDDEYRVTASNVTVNNTPQRTDNRGSMVVARTRTYWQPPMDRYFIDVMLDHVQKGDQIDGLFHKQAWMEMTTSFNARFGFKYETDILKNRYKTLRRQYNLIKNLLELDGFMWDETRQMVTADDWVWQDYIKVLKVQAHTDARQYMTRPVPYYKDLCVVCRELSGVDGRGSVSDYTFDQQDGVHEVKLNRELRRSQSPDASASSADLIGNDEQDSSHVGSKITVADQKNKRQSENQSSSAHSKKSRSKQEGMASALQEMATAVSSLADDRKDDNSNSTAIENVIEAIQALPDMGDDLVLDSCDFLEDEKKAKTFMALDVKLRKKWLIRKLRANQ